MRNLHTLIVGQTGSGKSTLVNALLALTARVIVLDRKQEYAPAGAHISYTFADASLFFLSQRSSSAGFALVFRPYLETDYFRLIRLARHAQRTEGHGPLVIVLEEASAYSDVGSMDETIRELYNQGRHERISLLSVVQMDTDIHRVTRANSAVIVTLKQVRLSGDFQRYFAYDAIERLVSLRDEYTPHPVQGRHFAVYPPGVDLYATWREEHGYVLELERRG